MTDDALIHPSDDERKNGWDAVSLTAYLNERAGARLGPLDWTTRERPKPRMANGAHNGAYSPLTHWRTR